jgi:hypothetical protein
MSETLRPHDQKYGEHFGELELGFESTSIAN